MGHPLSSVAFGVFMGLLPAGLLGVVALAGALLAWLRPGLPGSFHRWLSCIGLVGALAASLITLYGLRLAPGGTGLVAFEGSLVVDRFAVLGTVMVVLLALLTSLGSGLLAARIPGRAGAFHALLLVLTAAAALLFSQREMVALFAELQLLLLTSVLLVGLAKASRRSSEAALKQLVLTVVGSGLLALGLTLLYGVSGSTDLATLVKAQARAPALTATAATLCLGGLALALGALPLQQGLVQLAEGAPAPIAGLISSVGVIAGLGAYLRLLAGGFGISAPLAVDAAAVLAAATMLHAALLLLRRQSLRRAAAQLVVAQAGFMLLGALSVSRGPDERAGLVALLVYAMSFGVTVLALFGALGILEEAGMSGDLDQPGRRGRRLGGTGLALTAAVAGLGGLPPLAIFVARSLVLESTVLAGFAWAALLGVLASVVLAAGSLRLIARIHLAADDGEPSPAGPIPRLPRVVVGICALASLAFTALVQPLLAVSSGGAGTLQIR